jgi:penicillin-insensitive murein endopeptidase
VPRLLVLRLLALLLCLPVTAGAESLCRGTTVRGALEGGCKLPGSGANFTAYSTLGRLLGRTYVHCTVAEVVEAAYAAMAVRQPEVRFVYGETGFAEGGPFKPHKTHQNGLSVDFFVPVRNAEGESVPLSTHTLNRWGYELELDGSGRLDDWRIDFEAMAAHLVELRRAAEARGIGIWRVIFDPKLQPFLLRTAAWPALAGKVQFSTRPSWVRHDEHYHVDFDAPCQPL